MENAEKAIAELESAQSALEARLAQGESDAELLEEYAKVKKSLENQMSVWELAQMQYDELKNR